MNIRRLACLSAIVAASSLYLAQGPARADDASDLLAKHKAYVGWQFGDGTFKTLRFTETYSTPKRGVVDTAEVSRSNALYRATHTSSKGLVTSDGFTGRLFWESNQNGFTRPVLGDQRNGDIAYEVAFNEGATLATGKSQGTATIDGQSFGVVRIPTPGNSVDLYIDPQTGVYKRIVIDPDGSGEQTIDVLGYTDVVPGKKVISKFKYAGGQGTFERTNFVANPTVGVADLHPPQQTATWNFANHDPFKIEVGDQRIIISAKVNGVPGRFLLDTGADGILLTQNFAKKAGVKQITTSAAGGIGPMELKTDVDRVDTLEIGGNTLSNVIVTSALLELASAAPDGLIGFDLFGGAVVTVNTDANTMMLSDPATTQVDKSAGIAATIDLSTGQPGFPVMFNGKYKVNAILDSGNFYYVLFGKELMTRHGLAMLVDNTASGYAHSHITTAGVGGVETEECGHLDSVSFGPIVYQGAPACSSNSLGAHEALLGFDFFRNFNYVFDYPEATMILTPHKN